MKKFKNSYETKEILGIIGVILLFCGLVYLTVWAVLNNNIGDAVFAALVVGAMIGFLVRHFAEKD